MADKVQILLLLWLWFSHYTLNVPIVEREQYKNIGYQSPPLHPLENTSTTTMSSTINTETQERGDHFVTGDSFVMKNTLQATDSEKVAELDHLTLKWKERKSLAGHEVEISPASGQGNGCPVECQCSIDKHRRMTSVDCSNRGLTSIPKFPDTSLQVFLQNNNIRSIPCYSFSPLRLLKMLDLSGNSLDDLYNCSLHGLVSLADMKIVNSGLSSLLSSVFDPLISLQKLDLSQNNLTGLTNQPFVALDKLKTLDISGNILSHIKNGTFRGLSSLTFLSLRSNQLRYLPSTFEPGAFSHLVSLETLKLQGNQAYYDDNFTYPDLALSRLKTLRHLSLDGYCCSLGDGFASLSSLASLVFSDTDSYCDLSHVSQEFFQNINTSQPLDLRLVGCNIVNPLPPTIFEHVPTINNLALGGNHMGIDAFESSSYGLRNSNLTALDISSIKIIDKEDIAIKDTTFKSLKNTKLRRLVCQHNRISYVSPQAIGDLPRSLEFLDFSYNRIVHDGFIVYLSRLTNLKVAMLANQVPFHMDSPRLISLEEINSSKYSDMGKFYSNKENLKTVTLSHATRVSEAERDFCSNSKSSGVEVLREDKRIWPLPVHLQELYASNTNLKYDITVLTVTNNKDLRILDLSRNDFNCLGGPFKGFTQLQHLDLSGISCYRMSTFVFSNLPNLKTLLLYDNWLGQSLAEDVDGLTFSTLTRLENLNLRNNGIKKLADTAFTFNPDLRVINLARNDLSRFQPTLVNNTRLTILNLTTNALTGLTQTICREFMHIKRHNPEFKIFISDNKFLCTCENLPFFSLLLEQPDIFADIELFQCQFTNGSYLAYSKLDHFLPLLGSQCFAQSLFVIVLVTFSCLILVLSLSSVYYYKRWQWKYLYHLARLRLRIDAMDFTDVANERIFITYDLDAPFFRWLIHDKILPQLRYADIPVVLGEVDFLPGPVAVSIAGAVTNTRKTLIVLSRNIFEDPERVTEINFAIMHELYIGRQILVPVLHFGPMQAPPGQRGMLGVEQREVELAEMYTVHGHEGWHRDMGFPCYTDVEWTMVSDLLDTFPPEIACYLYGQVHRCLLYDGESPHFWDCLKHALLSDD